MVSVVMATYNGTKYLDKQLCSIRDQTLRPDEVIICDDGSTDGTVELVEQFIEENQLENWSITRNVKNLGYARNFLHAMELASGDILIFSDQDDIWLPEKVETVKRWMEKEPAILCLFSQYTYIDGEDCIISTPYKKYVQKPLYQVSFPEHCNDFAYAGMSLAIRSELKREMIDVARAEEEIIAHDWLATLLAVKTHGFYTTNQVLTYYRLHTSNTVGVDLRAQDRRDNTERLETLQRDLRHYRCALDILKNQFGKSQQKNIAYLKNRIRVMEKRIQIVSEARPFSALAMIGQIGHYPFFKNYLGDFLFAVGAAKFFDKGEKQ